jgi:hypothetical protein
MIRRLEFRTICDDDNHIETLTFRPIQSQECPHCQRALADHYVQYRIRLEHHGPWRAMPWSPPVAFIGNLA